MTLAALQKALNGTINAKDQKTLSIDWDWPYETGTSEKQIADNDDIDTKDVKDLPDYSFDIIISGTQVNPQ